MTLLVEKKNVYYGVPQGTVLGPILFTLYVNDLFYLPSIGDIVSFADDTAIFYKDSSWESLKYKVENDFKMIVNFFRFKILTINTQKTHFVPFTSYPQNLPIYNTLSIEYDPDNYCNITSVENIKYLGVTVDRHMRWDKQINNITNKLRYLLPIFKYLKNFCDIDQLKILYFGLVQCHLSYGILAWGGVTNNYLKKLETVQKRIIKVIYNKTQLYPSNELYRDTKLFDLRQLFCQSILVNQQKQKSCLKKIAHKYETRHKKYNIKTPISHKTIGQRGYTYLSPRIYNCIPMELKELNSINLFKNRIKKWIQDRPREYIHQLIDIKNF